MDTIQVVLASPSDLAAERQMIKDLIDDELNTLCKKYNLFVDLRRWEESLPGLNPRGPQGLIDLDLEIPRADIFICMYGRKIGTIIKDEGIAGTEHELNTALRCNQLNGKPDIKTYFLETDANNPPDKDIRRIANRIKDLGLYGTFKDKDDLKDKIRRMLMDAVMNKIQTHESKRSQSEIEKYVAVKTMADLVSTVEPQTHIIIRSQILNVLDFNDATRYVSKVKVFDGDELTIQNLKGVSIEAFYEDAPILMTKPRYAAVISLYNCENITFSKLTFGHVPDKGSCSGPVIRMHNCKNVTFDSVKLFGCGTYGIQAFNCENVNLLNSEIYECTLGAIYIKNSDLSLNSSYIYDCYTQSIDSLIYVCGGIISLNKVCISYCNSKKYLIYLEQLEKGKQPDKMGYSRLVGHDIVIDSCDTPFNCNCDINQFISKDGIRSWRGNR